MERAGILLNSVHVSPSAVWALIRGLHGVVTVAMVTVGLLMQPCKEHLKNVRDCLQAVSEMEGRQTMATPH